MRINLRKTKPMKRDLVYTTGDLPMSPFDTIHFLTPSPHQNRRRRARVEKVGLMQFFHVAAGAVDLFVKIARLALGPRERGDDEARIGLVFGPFRLRHHPAGAAPARPRPPPEVLETPRRLAATPAQRRSLLKLGLDFGDEPVGLRQSEQKVHAVGLAPSHQLLAREA